MKKKIIYTLIPIFIIGFFLSHIPEIGNYIFNKKGLSQYSNGYYTGALEDFLTASKFKQTPETLLNLGNSSYMLGDYFKAQSFFESIPLEYISSGFKFKIYHNLGNVYYQLGKISASIEDTISEYEKSIEMYNQALNIQNDQETYNNREYVKKELEKLKKIQQENTQNQEKEQEGGKEGDTQSQQKEKNQTGTGSGTGSADQDNQIQQSRDEEYMLDEKDTVPEITQQEKQYLENYRDFLERLQKDNQQNFNKIPRQQSDFFDLFGGDPFFQDNFGTDKDW